MKSYIGLYYPFIHFKDDAWVKLTALYWDKMGRIVPRGYRTRDSDTVRQLADESGFIEDVFAGFSSYDLNLDSAFTQLLQQHEAELRDRYGVSHRHEWPDNPEARVAAPPGTDPKLAYVYIEKMSPELTNSFVDSGLALADSHIDSDGHPIEVGRVGMHPKLAFIYMTALAEGMAAGRGYHPVTDETLNHVAVTGCTLERLAQALLGDIRLSGPAATEQEVEAQMAMIAFESVVPRDIANVPIKKIIALRERHATERAAFQQHLHEIVTKMGELQRIEDRGALQAHLDVVYDKQLKPQLDEYRRRLHSLGIDTVVGAFNVQARLPQLITSVAALAGLAPINPILAAGGALAFSVLPVIRDKQKEARDLVRSSPPAYLMNVEEGLGSTTLMGWIAQRARQFFFRV